MNSFANSTRGRRTVRPAGPILAAAALLALAVVVSSCSSHKLTAADARQRIESSPRFTAPDVMTVRSRYCATIDAPADNPASGLGRLQALAGTGAIRIDHRAAAPGECAATPGPMRE